jgi:energy-coupling factor transporter ATP-binding protein EcfA2
MPSAIRFDGVSFSYPDGTPALHELKFSVEQNDRVALLGRNGSGKSTLFLAMLGFLIPQEGRIAIDDIEVNRGSLQRIRSHVGLVFQNPDDQLFCPTLYDDVAFGPWNSGMAKDELDAVVESTLRDVGLWHLRDKSPHHLSWGEKRRAALATVLSMSPGILLLDEPTAFLDPPSTKGLYSILHRYSGTMILATHNLGFARALCNRVVLMEDGEIKYAGDTGATFSDTDVINAHGLIHQFDEFPE